MCCIGLESKLKCCIVPTVFHRLWQAIRKNYGLFSFKLNDRQNLIAIKFIIMRSGSEVCKKFHVRHLTEKSLHLIRNKNELSLHASIFVSYAAFMTSATFLCNHCATNIPKRIFFRKSFFMKSYSHTFRYTYPFLKSDYFK